MVFINSFLLITLDDKAFDASEKHSNEKKNHIKANKSVQLAVRDPNKSDGILNKVHK